MAEKRASLPARHELKFFIGHGEIERLRQQLRKVMTLDPHCINGKPYMIRSLYFDDFDNSAWYDKQSGVMDRDKYRIRIYRMSDAEIFLERKRKQGDLIQKDSVRISRRLADQLIDGNPSGLYRSGNALIRDLFVQMRTKLLKPAVIVDYEREAYTAPVEDVRVTFDLKLRSGLNHTDMFNDSVPTICPHDRNVEIVEVKYNNYLPDYVRMILADVQAEQSAVSKYILCRRFEPLDGV